MNIEDHRVYYNDDSLIPPSSLPPLTETKKFLDSRQQQSQAKENSFNDLSKLTSKFPLGYSPDASVKLTHFVPVPSSQPISTSQLGNILPQLGLQDPNSALSQRSKSYGSLQQTQDDAGEYLPSTPSFQTEDYLDVLSNLTPDQIQAQPFTMRRRIKALMSGTATDADVRTVSQNLNSIMQAAASAEGSSQENSNTALSTPQDTEPVNTNTSAMPIQPSLVGRSPVISPNTSVFFNEADSILSPSSQSILRSQSLLGSRQASMDRSATFNLGGTPRHIHRSATMYQGTPRQSSAGSERRCSRSASLSSSVNSPALQYLTRFASHSFSPSADPFARDSSAGEEVGGYIIGKMIGYGGFSEVKEAHTIENGEKKTLAVKIVHKIASNIPVRNPEIMTQDALDQVQNAFLHEVTLWKTLDHPNILKLLNVYEDDKAVYCFTDKISGGTLFDLIRKTKRKGLRPRLAINYIQQISSALLYLHETMHIVHRDIKPENCLIEEESDGRSRVVLCDFGMSDNFHTDEMDDNMGDENGNEGYWSEVGPSRACGLFGPADTSSQLNQYHRSTDKPHSSKSSSRATSRRNSLFADSPSSSSVASDNFGSLPYASPEVLESKTPIFLPTVDMWALGILMYTMFEGRFPWQHTFAPKLRTMITEAKWSKEAFGQRVYELSLQDGDSPQAAEKVSRQVLLAVMCCLEPDVEQRWTIRQVAEHDWGYTPSRSQTCEVPEKR